jgi:hypothetical protein
VNGSGATPLYILFVQRCQELISLNGFLSFITPPTPFKIGMGGYIKPNEVFHINNDAGDFFTVSTAIWYFVQQSGRIGPTTITKNKKSYTVTINKTSLLTASNEIEYSILCKIASYRGGVSLSNVQRNIIPLPIGAVFLRRMNRYTTFDAKLTYVGMWDDIKLNQDYTLVHPKAEKVVETLNSDLYTFLLRRYQTSPFITISWIRSLNIPIENPESEIGLTPDEVTYLRSLDYTRSVFIK